MKRKRLSSRWIRWRRRRYGVLIAEGLPGYIAWDIAAGEAAFRSRLAKVIGTVNAIGARLMPQVIGDDVKFYVAIDPASLNERQTQALMAQPGLSFAISPQL